MGMPCYLAMTATEFAAADTLPEHPAWMACHFSCYGTGLSNLPRQLPEGSMVIVNDRTPIQGHDPALILEQLTQLYTAWQPNRILLDFQRPGEKDTGAVAKLLAQELPCPVGVTEYYARELDCPVFLPPPPLNIPLKEHLAPWAGREIWLEAALVTERITVTPEGSQWESIPWESLAEPSFADPLLHCRYHMHLGDAEVVFTLERDRQLLTSFLEEAETLSVTQAVGLYQQLRKARSDPSENS